MSDLRPGAGTAGRTTGVLERGRFQRLQALEDAIAYRRARVSVPCGDCEAAGPDQKCDDHARDLQLIAEYLDTVERSVLLLSRAAAGGAAPRFS